MLERHIAMDLARELEQRLGLPHAGWAKGESKRIPRPALFGPNWSEFNTHEAIKPRVEVKTPEELNEVFAGYVDLYLMQDGDPYMPPMAYLVDEMGVSATDRPALFPPQRTLKPSPQEALEGLALLLYCAHVMGYQLLYGRDWAAIACGEFFLGFDQGKTICQYPQLCVEVNADFSWRNFYERPRSTGGNEPDILYYWFTRSRSVLHKDNEEMSQAVMTLAWAARDYRVQLAQHFLPVKVSSSELTNITRRILQHESPFHGLKEILVPSHVSQATYYKVAAPHRWGEALWTEEECRNFVATVLEQLAITKIRKGKTHANSNNRKGRSR